MEPIQSNIPMCRETGKRLIKPETQNQVIDGLYDKKSLTEILEELRINPRSFYEALEDNPDFYLKLEKARAIIYDNFADDLVNIPDIYRDVQRAKLKSDNLKWIMSRRLPDRWGDKVQVQVENINLNDALSEAKARLRPISDRSNEFDADYSEVSDTYDESPSDKPSLDEDIEDAEVVESSENDEDIFS